MQGLRKEGGVSYTTPDTFLELELDYKAQRKLIKSSKRGNEKQRVLPARQPASDGEGDGSNSSGSDTAVQKSDRDEDEEEVDQLASSDLEDAAMKDERPRKKKGKKVAGGNANGKTTDGKKVEDRLRKLPNELLVEVFTHLPLSTLLSLSRCNKRLRAILVAPSSSNLWFGAREEAGLPELEASEMSDEGYAELVLGKRCMACGKPAPRMPDCFLRVRFCKSCRTSELVKLDTLSKTHPELHFAAGLCVLRSSQTLSQPTHLALSAHWAPLRALEAHNEVLWSRQEKDDAANETTIAMAFASKHDTGMSGRVSKSRRHHESDGEEEDGDGGAAQGADDSGVGLYEYAELGRKEGQMGKNVERYVKKRREVLDPLEEEGKKLFKAVKKLVEEESHGPARKKKHEDDLYPPSERRAELERRVLALGEEYGEEDFNAEPWQKSKVVNEGSDEVDDEAFDALKPKLLKILSNAKAKRALEDYKASQLSRQQALRPFYNDHRGSRTFYPLFADFLLLPSVAALWQAKEGDIDAASFAAVAAELEADLDEWVVETRLAAIMLILNRTLDIPEDEELDSDADAYESYNDEWFSLLSSCLVCPLKGCYEAPSAGERGRPTFYGTLGDLFAHQHADHADTLDLPPPVKAPKKNDDEKAKPPPKTAKKGKKAKAAPPPRPLYHFSLPLEVASAADALTDLLAKDIKAMRRRDEEDSSSAHENEDEEMDEDEEPTIQEVDRLFEEHGEWKLRWWDGLKAKGTGEREWRRVFCHAKREAERVAKVKPPRVILPCLGFK